MVVLLAADNVEAVAQQCAGLLEAGETVVLPTDTVYGVAALASQEQAVDRLAELKGRDPSKPIAVLVADPASLDTVAQPSATARRLASAFWPGALTLVVQRAPGFTAKLGGDEETVGVRCPDSPLVRRIAALVGPLATTSANLSGQPTPEVVGDIAETLGDVGLIVDAGRLGGLPSTVVDCSRHDDLRILREAAVSADDLHSALNESAGELAMAATIGIDELKSVAFFDGFSDSHLERVAALVQDVAAEPGALLIDQGRPGQVCYVIAEGKANVFVGREHVATLQPGTMVGEMALIDHKPRSASVVAEGPMRLLALNTDAFRALLDELPEAKTRVLALLEARLEATAAVNAAPPVELD